MAEKHPDTQEDLSKLNPEIGNNSESFADILKGGDEKKIRSAMESIGRLAGKSDEQIAKDVEKVLSRQPKVQTEAVAEADPASETLDENEGYVPVEKIDVSDLESEQSKEKAAKNSKLGRKVIAVAALLGLAGALWAGVGNNKQTDEAPNSEISNSVSFNGFEHEDSAEHDFVYDSATDLNLSLEKRNAYGGYAPNAFRTPIEANGDKTTFNENMIEGWKTTPVDLAATCVAYETVMAGGTMNSGIDLRRVNELTAEMKTNPESWKEFYNYCSDLTTQGLEEAGITSSIEKAPSSYYSLWSSEGVIKQAVYSNINGGTDAMVYRDAAGNMLMMKLDWCGNVGFETPITGVPIETPPEEQPPEEEPPVLEAKIPSESTYNNVVKDSYQGNNGETFTVSEETITDSFVEPTGTTITVEGGAGQGGSTYEIPIETVPASPDALGALKEAQDKAAAGNAVEVAPNQPVNTGSVEE